MTNINTLTGIRFGVISLNSLDPDVANDLWVNGHDESYAEEIDEPHIVGERDGVTYQITWLGGAPLLWVLDGPTGLANRLCSPCVPNAADLDSGFVFEEERDRVIDDGWPCYVVPRDWLADDLAPGFNPRGRSF